MCGGEEDTKWHTDVTVMLREELVDGQLNALFVLRGNQDVPSLSSPSSTGPRATDGTNHPPSLQLTSKLRSVHFTKHHG